MSEKEDGKTEEKNVNFKRIFLIFVVVNAILFIINLIFSPNHLWFYWITIIWGILLLIQYLRLGGS